MSKRTILLYVLAGIIWVSGLLLTGQSWMAAFMIATYFTGIIIGILLEKWHKFMNRKN